MSEARQCIFITGAGSGIGRATAKHFAGEGWFVGAYDVDGTPFEGSFTVTSTRADPLLDPNTIESSILPEDCN